MTEIAFNGWSESDQKAIREQLDRILNSGPFQQSRRRQRFLEYIVNEALAGRGERLKGYSVALAVFDRAETFDSNIDPIVRNEAARMRDRLREYYEGEGQAIPFASSCQRAPMRRTWRGLTKPLTRVLGLHPNLGALFLQMSTYGT